MSDLEEFYRFPDGALKKKELLRAVGEQAGVRTEAVQDVLNALADVITLELSNGYSLRVPGVGFFSPYVKSYFDTNGVYHTQVRCQFRPASAIRKGVNDWLDRNLALEKLEETHRAERRPTYKRLTEQDYMERDAAPRVKLR